MPKKAWHFKEQTAESPNFFLAIFALLYIRKCVCFNKLICFNNEGDGYLLETSIYNSMKKNKMGIDNFRQI